MGGETMYYGIFHLSGLIRALVYKKKSPLHPEDQRLLSPEKELQISTSS